MNYGILLVMGNAGFISSTAVVSALRRDWMLSGRQFRSNPRVLGCLAQSILFAVAHLPKFSGSKSTA